MIEDLLYDPFLGPLPAAAFRRRWREEVGDFGLVERKLVDGDMALTVYQSGLVTSVRNKLWTGWKSKRYVQEREYYANWAEFARAGWTDKVPTQPGVYPVQDLEGNRGRDRTLEIVGARLIDTSGGLVTRGKVTEWRGKWWRLPYPELYARRQ